MKVLIASLVLAASFAAHAQADWPRREVRVLVGFTAGGTTDIIARLLAAELNRAWAQPVLVENRPGATGNIAAEQVARAKPDGYTLLMGSVGPLAVNASLYKSMPFDNLKDLAPVSLVAHVPNVLVMAPKAMPAVSFADFVAIVKASPGKYFYASTGSGTTSHLTGELLRLQGGLQLVHVPYKGAVALNDVLAGEAVHVMFATIPSAINHIRAGKLRALAVSSPKRSAGLPDVPTIAESGFPGFDASSWFGLVGPAGLPAEVAAKVSAEVARILREPGMRDKFVQQGSDPVGSTPEEFGAYIRAETEKWARVVKATGARVD